MVNSENQIKLTISILISNRKDTVPKCLESLRPLLEQVDSELIITDTGCDDDLLSYIKSFTDNIVRFKWCDDFAAARNVGLRLAKGQWFMYIDDDEWFEDVTEIVDFFVTEEDKNYMVASYIVRNYSAMDGKHYNESLASRMFRIKEGMEFIGRVHEYIPFTEGKEKQFSVFAHHYGYAFDDYAKKELHYERNTSLLKKEIEKTPNIGRYYSHLFQEFKSMNKSREALEYAFKALECVEDDEGENRLSMCSTYACVLWAYNTLEEYENVIKWGKEFLETKPITGLTKAAIVSYMAEAYMSLNDCESTVKYIDEYIRLDELYRWDKKRFYNELGPILNVFVSGRKDNVLSIGLEAALELRDIRRTLDYIDSFDWARDVHIDNMYLICRFVELIANVDVRYGHRLFRDCVKILGKLFTNVEISKVVLNTVADLKERDTKGCEQAYLMMAHIAGQRGYADLVKIITANRASDIELLYELCEKVVSDEQSIFGMDKIFFEVARDKNIPLGQMIKNISLQNWTYKLKESIPVMTNKELVILKKYLDVFLEKEEDYLKRFEAQLVKELENRKR